MVVFCVRRPTRTCSLPASFSVSLVLQSSSEFLLVLTFLHLAISNVVALLLKTSVWFGSVFYFKKKLGSWFGLVFRRNAMHCISPYAIVMCACVCLCVCVCVCMLCLWTSGKRFEIETSFFVLNCLDDTGHNP